MCTVDWPAWSSGGLSLNDRHFKRHGRWLSENAKECTVKDNFHSLLSISKS